MSTSNEVQVAVNEFIEKVVKSDPLMSRSRKSWQAHQLFLDDESRMIFLLTEELCKHIKILELNMEEAV
tara:strand:+ start:348 stop:554 length:207 start_codon:yes stop_codon:yes gene_type:complete